MMARSPQVVSLRCGHDGSSSSSSESSEEVSQESERHKLKSQTVVALYAQALFPQVFLRRRQQFNAPFANRGKHIFTFSFVFFLQ